MRVTGLFSRERTHQAGKELLVIRFVDLLAIWCGLSE